MARCGGARARNGRDPTLRSPRRASSVARPRPRHGAVHRHREFDRPRRRAWRQSLAGAPQRHHAIMRRCLAEFRGDELDTAGDSSSPHSTVPAARSSAPWRSCATCRRSGSRSGPACTPESASGWTANSRVSLSPSEPGSPLWQSQAKSLSPEPFKTSSPAHPRLRGPRSARTEGSSGFVANRRRARSPLDGLTNHVGHDGNVQAVRSNVPVLVNVTRASTRRAKRHLAPCRYSRECSLSDSSLLDVS